MIDPMKYSGDLDEVVFVIPFLKGGGAEKVALVLLEYFDSVLRDKKIDIVLFEKKPLPLSLSNVEVKCLNVPEGSSAAYKVWKFFKTIFLLVKMFRGERPVVVLSFMDYSNVVCIISNYLSGNRHRVIASVHTLSKAYTMGRSANVWSKLVGILVKWTYNKAEGVVAVSKGVRDDLVRNFNVDYNKITVINNPVNIENISALSDEDAVDMGLFGEGPVVLFVGRLVKVKGIDCLLKAFSQVSGKMKVKLLIVGEGSEEHNLKKLSKSLGIERDVFFLGYKDNPYPYMKRASVFVLPSLYEGFGVVIVEAMACGLPVISTKSYEGIEDIIEDGVNGLLVPVADEKAMSDAIYKVLADKGFSTAVSENMLRLSSVFSVNKVGEQYRAFLKI